MIGCWDFNDVSNGVVRDLSGNDHHGKIHGTPEIVQGVSGAALKFSTNDDYVDFGRPLVPEKDFTISVWLNCDAVDKQFFLGQYQYKHPNRLDLAIREGAVRIQIGNIVNSQKIIEKNQWYNIVYTRKNNLMKIYMNGALVKEAELDAAVIQSENLMLGKINVPDSTAFRFTGMLDELRIYHGALNADEIKTQYENLARLSKEAKPCGRLQSRLLRTKPE